MAAEAAAYATEDWQAQLEEVLALHAIFAKDFRCVCVCGGGGGAEAAVWRAHAQSRRVVVCAVLACNKSSQHVCVRGVMTAARTAPHAALATQGDTHTGRQRRQRVRQPMQQPPRRRRQRQRRRRRQQPCGPGAAAPGAAGQRAAAALCGWRPPAQLRGARGRGAALRAAAAGDRLGRGRCCCSCWRRAAAGQQQHVRPSAAPGAAAGAVWAACHTPAARASDAAAAS
jgi:hypothetical protein